MSPGQPFFGVGYCKNSSRHLFLEVRERHLCSYQHNHRQVVAAVLCVMPLIIIKNDLIKFKKW